MHTLQLLFFFYWFANVHVQKKRNNNEIYVKMCQILYKLIVEECATKEAYSNEN